MTSLSIIDALVFPQGNLETAIAFLIFLGVCAGAAGLIIAVSDLICWLCRGVWIIASEVWGLLQRKHHINKRSGK